jgi:hypothetical protein
MYLRYKAKTFYIYKPRFMLFFLFYWTVVSVRVANLFYKAKEDLFYYH